MRKKNRNYRIHKRVSLENLSVLNKYGATEELVTRLKGKKERAWKHAQASFNESCKANLRARNAFF